MADFEDNNEFITDPSRERFVKSRLCIDKQVMKENLFVKNGYANNKERISFAIIIIKCEGEGCKTDEEITTMLENIYFTMYYLQEEVAFSNIENYGSRPLIIKEKFHS